MFPIFLVGYMCSGKTTLGVAVSQALGVPFVDLDQWIEAEQQMSVPEIFAQHGEAAFRQMEMAALSKLAYTEAIVACGGGTPCQPGAMELMNQQGVTVWLQPNDERLLMRLMDGRATRPLIANIETEEEMAKFVDAAMRIREPFYSQSQLRFDSSELESEQEIEQSSRLLCALLRQHSASGHNLS